VSQAIQPAWRSALRTLVFRHAWLKATGTMLFIGVFFGGYFYLLKHPASTPTPMPLIWLDSLIGFQPLALPVYLSLWIYVSLPPLFIDDRRELYGYGLAMALMCGLGLAIFYFWPTVVPAPDIDWIRYPNMIFLKNIDAAGNACPSLHVATALFSGLWLRRSLRRINAPGWLVYGNALWCVGIIYSTMAIRQHVAVDVGAGLLLGIVSAWMSLLQAGPIEPFDDTAR
jgi:membrane-associated phospholipid phosphatase